MLLLIFIAFVLVVSFGSVVLFGPPFVPTMHRQVGVALDLLDLRPGQTLLELGSGDGRVMLAAAQRGYKVVGIELNPILVLFSRWRTRKYSQQVRVIWGNYFRVVWPPADGIFTFMLGRQMARLDKHIDQWHTKPIHLASFAFKVPGKKPIKSQDGVFLYLYK